MAKAVTYYKYKKYVYIKFNLILAFGFDFMEK